MSQLENLLRASLGLRSDNAQVEFTLDEARKWLVRVGSAAERGDLDSARMDEKAAVPEGVEGHRGRKPRRTTSREHRDSYV